MIGGDRPEIIGPVMILLLPHVLSIVFDDCDDDDNL